MLSIVYTKFLFYAKILDSSKSYEKKELVKEANSYPINNKMIYEFYKDIITTSFFQISLWTSRIIQYVLIIYISHHCSITPWDMIRKW